MNTRPSLHLRAGWVLSELHHLRERLYQVKLASNGPQLELAVELVDRAITEVAVFREALAGEK